MGTNRKFEICGEIPWDLKIEKIGLIKVLGELKKTT